MKRKVGTTVDAALYQRAKETARRQGRSLNEVIEEALGRYVTGATGSSIVVQTRGSFKVSDRVLRRVLEEDLYGPD